MEKQNLTENYEATFEKTAAALPILSKMMNLIKSFYQPAKVVEEIVIPVAEKVPTELEKKQMYLQEMFQDFLGTKNYDLIMEMIKNGYQMPKDQKEELYYTHINFLLSDFSDTISNKWIELEKWIGLGLDVSDKTKEGFFYRRIVSPDMTKYDIDFFLTKNESIVCPQYDDGKQIQGNVACPLLTESLRNFMQQNEQKIFNKVFKDLSENLCTTYSNDKKLIKQLSTVLKGDNRDCLLRDVPIKDFLDVIQKAKSNFSDEQEKLFKDVLKDYYASTLNNLIVDTKKVYGAEYLSNLTMERITKDSHNVVAKELPKEVSYLLESITELYGKISDRATPEEKFNVDNLFEKRIPEILKKYVTIDPEYRTTLLNSNGKNAQELMMDSLENIKSHFTSTWEQINQAELISLSATNRYTTNFKMK